MGLVFFLMVLVLISVTTFYAFGSFGPGEIVPRNESAAVGPGGIVPENRSAAVGPGGIVPDNQSGSIIPSTGVMNSEQNEKKS
jgi:hypothetical protein